jgi:hypothetical protein
MWIARSNPVEIRTTKKNCNHETRLLRACVALWTKLRAALRLIGTCLCIESHLLFPRPVRKKGVIVHCFEEIIGGRTYQIEVTPVSNRWRAQIRRVPGMPTALMPFYGQTPDEAARQLSQWLTLANGRSHTPGAAHPLPPVGTVQTGTV